MKSYRVIILMIFVFSCSSLTVENEETTPVEQLTPTTIETDHGVMDVLVDPDDFDRMYRNHRQDIIIEGRVDWYGSDQKLILDSASVQIEIKGSGSTINPLKSLGFIFEEEIDNSEGQFLNPEKVLDFHSLNTLRSVRVRNSGSDFYRTMFKDLAYTQMVIEAELDIDFMYGQPIHVFVNGDYYGLMNVRTESNEYAISRLRASETDEITLMDADNNLEFRAGNEDLARQLITAVKNGETDELWELINISNFVDYLIFEEYVGNHDWPNRNCKTYSLNGAPFRFFLFDLDRASERPNWAVLPKLEYQDFDVALIFQALMKHPEFCDRLKSRRAEIYEMLSTHLFNRIVTRFAARIEDDIPYQIGKYNHPDSKLHWRLHIERVKRDFEVQNRNIRKKYDLQND